MSFSKVLFSEFPKCSSIPLGSDQNADRQLEPLAADRVFTDKASGKDTERPQLQALLQYAREGDTIVVHSMDRLARNLDDLRRLVLGQTKRGVCIQFIKESLTFTAEESPMANLLLSVMGAFAEFERALIKEHQREGIALARQRGEYLGRRKSLPPEKVAELRRRSNAVRRKRRLPASSASAARRFISICGKRPLRPPAVGY